MMLNDMMKNARGRTHDGEESRSLHQPRLPSTCSSRVGVKVLQMAFFCAEVVGAVGLWVQVRAVRITHSLFFFFLFFFCWSRVLPLSSFSLVLLAAEVDTAYSDDDNNDDDNHNGDDDEPELEVLPPHRLLQSDGISLEGVGLDGNVLGTLHQVLKLLSTTKNGGNVLHHDLLDGRNLGLNGGDLVGALNVRVLTHLLTQNGVERGAILASIASTDLLQKGEDDSRVHGLVSDSQVDTVSLSNVVDRVSFMLV